MLLNFISFVLILAVAAYLANQGLFSAILIFITATFASILAGCLFEPLDYLIAGWKQEWGRGLTFLLLFGVAFFVCRLAADMTIPKNIKVTSQLVNRILGGLFGFLGSLIIVGSFLIGVQMLPLPTSILGYNRFPTETAMQGDGPAVVAKSSNIWFAPDRFTLAFWKLASGHALGGDLPFASVHPDLLTESYGYRNTVQDGTTITLPPDLLNVSSAWMSSEPEVLSALKITEPGKAAVIIRAEITGSTEPPKVSVNSASSGNDVKPYFFVTPSAVRIVTNQGRQYYAIGYLEKGRAFTSLPLDSGQLADDAPASGKIVEDWVFQINSDEKPLFIEIKEARKPVASILKTQPVLPLASTEYPPRAYRQTQGSTRVVLSGFDSVKFDTIKVIAAIRSTNNRVGRPIFATPYANITAALVQINNGTAPWSVAAGKSGVPSADELNNAHRILQVFVNAPPEEHLFWDEFLPFSFFGVCTTDGPHNLIVLPKFVDDTVMPALQSSILSQGTMDASGKLVLADLPKGPLVVIVTAKNDKSFYVWTISKEIVSKTETEFSLTPNNASFTCILK